MYLAHGINVEHRCSCDRLKLASEIDENLPNKRSLVCRFTMTEAVTRNIAEPHEIIE